MIKNKLKIINKQNKQVKYYFKKYYYLLFINSK